MEKFVTVIETFWKEFYVTQSSVVEVFSNISVEWTKFIRLNDEIVLNIASIEKVYTKKIWIEELILILAKPNKKVEYMKEIIKLSKIKDIYEQDLVKLFIKKEYPDFYNSEWWGFKKWVYFLMDKIQENNYLK